MRPPSLTCARSSHVDLDSLWHDRDVNGTPVASAAVFEVNEQGYTVTQPRRTESPNGLAWPAVKPIVRPKPTPEPCHACAAPKCRRAR